MRVWIGLGSNVGDRWEHLTAARDALKAIPGVHLEAFSRFWSNPPIGGPQGQGTFLNAVAQLRLDEEADPKPSPWRERAEWLLDQLQAIERQRGTAKTTRWDQRPLDLDLLLVGPELVGSSARLRVPHPRMTFRRFVLVPLHEIAPNLVIPPLDRTVHDLLAHHDRQPRVALVNGPDASAFTRRLLDQLAHQTPHRQARPLVHALPNHPRHSLPGGPPTVLERSLRAGRLGHGPPGPPRVRPPRRSPRRARVARRAGRARARSMTKTRMRRR